MHSLSKNISVMQETKYFGPATVMDVNENEGLVLLRLNCTEGEVETWGRSAIPYHHTFLHGETVIAAGEDMQVLYVIGIINNKFSDGTSGTRLSLKNGAYASVEKASEGEKLQLCTKTGELIFEYDPENGKSRVNIQSGDLDFMSGNGSINFISDRDIRFLCKQSIEMESQLGVRMSVTNTIGKILSSMNLKSRRIKISSPELGLNAQRGEFYIKESRFTGEKFSGTFKRAKVITGRLETMANDMIRKARNVYENVEGLTQLKTGRMRTLVKSALYMKAKKSCLKSEEDFKVKADKIHLG